MARFGAKRISLSGGDAIDDQDRRGANASRAPNLLRRHLAILSMRPDRIRAGAITFRQSGFETLKGPRPSHHTSGLVEIPAVAPARGPYCIRDSLGQFLIKPVSCLFCWFDLSEGPLVQQLDALDRVDDLELGG
jgi:hypothetical protein